MKHVKKFIKDLSKKTGNMITLELELNENVFDDLTGDRNFYRIVSDGIKTKCMISEFNLKNAIEDTDEYTELVEMISEQINK